jgi:hypothetical protein
VPQADPSARATCSCVTPPPVRCRGPGVMPSCSGVRRPRTSMSRDRRGFAETAVAITRRSLQSRLGPVDAIGVWAAPGRHRHAALPAFTSVTTPRP